MAAQKRAAKPKTPPKTASRAPSISSIFGAPSEPLTPEEKISKARELLFFSSPFFGSLAVYLPTVLIPPGHPDSERIRTAATDGKRILWNYDFVNSLNMQSMRFVYAHELAHCALQHLWRRNNRDPQMWNIATDAVINDFLDKDGMRFTGPIQLIRKEGAAEKSAEEVYDELVEDARNGKPPPQPGGSPNPDNTLDDHEYWSGEESDPDQHDVADHWRRALADAAQRLDPSKKHQNALILQIEKLLKPKVNWRALLTDGLTFPVDYQWRFPADIRTPGIMLPSLTGLRHQVVIAVDTSGSTTGQLLSEFWAEMLALLQMNDVEAVVLLADDDIRAEIRVEDFNPAMFETARGGGGTDFRPVFERVQQLSMEGFNPERVIYLTDLDGAFPDPATVWIPTLWVVSEQDAGKQPPFGQVIPLV